MMEDGIVEDATIASDLQFGVHSGMWKNIQIFVPSGVDFNKQKFADELTQEPGLLSVIELPEQANPDYFKVSESKLPDAPVFAYADRIRSRLAMQYPNSVQGVASGTSGRQEDVLINSGLAMYDAPLESNSKLWADALDIGFKIAFNKDLDILPVGLKDGDIDTYSEITVNLQKDNPMEISRRSIEGERLWHDGAITHERFLIEHMGMTKEDAKKEIAGVRIETAIRNSPFLLQIIEETVAEELGKEQRLQELRAQMQGASNMNPVPQPESKGGEPRTGNIKTPLGNEMADQSIRHEPRMGAVR